MAADDFKIAAVGTWLYDGAAPKRIELLCRPAIHAYSRWVEDDTGNFILNEASPVPTTADGMVYYIGASGGGEFLSIQAAIAWADAQPWGPVKWEFVKSS